MTVAAVDGARGRRAAILAATVAALSLLGGFVGGYDLVQWAPLGLAATIVAAGCVVATGWRPDRLALLALAALVVLWLWSQAAVLWAQDASAASLFAARLGVYAAVLVCFVRCTTLPGAGTSVLTGIAAGSVALAAWILGVLLVGDARGLLSYARLQEPLGYADGLAGLLALGVWPVLALAERNPRRPALAGAALGTCVVLVGLIVLTQSRSGTAALLLVSLLVLTVPGRWRRLGALVVVAAAVAAASGALLDVFRSRYAPPSDLLHALRVAGVTLLLAACVAGVAWAALLVATERLATDHERWAALRRRGHAALGTLLALGLAAGLLTTHPVARVSEQASAFTDLAPDRERSARFFTAAGNRYDYWRVAVREWRTHPVGGVGGGNFPLGYFRHRRTTEAIQQPHSLFFQTLSELGAVGVLLLGAVIAAVSAGWLRWRRAAARDPAAQAVAVGLGGAAASWLVHTGLDWIHLVVGATAVVVAAAAVLLRDPRSTADAARPGPAPPGRAATVLVVVLAALAAFGLVRLLAADRLEASGRSRLAADPVAAATRARDALALDPGRLPALYLLAAARARLDDYDGARRALLDAVDAVPDAATPRVLLGDLARRRGLPQEARTRYAEALARDPRDQELRRLLGQTGAGGSAP